MLHYVFVLLCNYRRFHERVQKYPNMTEKIKLLKGLCAFYLYINCALETHNDERNNSELNFIGVYIQSYLYGCH